MCFCLGEGEEGVISRTLGKSSIRVELEFEDSINGERGTVFRSLLRRYHGLCYRLIF